MKIKHVFNFFLIASALLLSTIGNAEEFKIIQEEKTTLTFSYKQMGVSMEGRFKRFVAQLDFDPTKLDNAKAGIDLDIGSIDVGSDEGNGEVVGKLWFNAKTFPRASFVASSVKPLGGNRYEVTGTLSIKGHTSIVKVPIIFTHQGKVGIFDGVFFIKRADFSIGEGSWSTFDIVANDIQIKFRIMATAK